MTAAIPTISREAFLAARKQGVGGSDVASVFSVGWGCRRRLWYDKRNVEPDFPRVATDAMELGTFLEAWFALKYEKETGRRVEVMGGPFVHPTVPELRVNIDRMIFKSGERKGGVLEIKSQGRGAFYKSKRLGLAEDYILQINHAMLVTGATWGAFAIGCRDSGELLHWDVIPDSEICAQILAEVPAFWATVENGPAPEALEPDDRRCQECCYRTSCQGNALSPAAKTDEYVVDESLHGLVLEYLERRDLKKEAEALLDDTKSELQAKLGDRTMVRSAGCKVQFYSFTKKAYTVPQHDERPLRIYPPKER